MPEKVLGTTLDVLKGFVWGDSSNLTQAGGELALAMIPYGGGIGDCRDMVREVCRWIMPGEDDHDWTNFNLALVSLVAELIPGGGTVSSGFIAPVKIALKLIKNLLVPITAVGIYHEELLEFLNFTTRALGNYFANTDFAGGKRFLDENGIVELLEFINRSTTESGLVSSNSLPGAGNSALLHTVSTGTVSDAFRKVVKGLSKIAKDREGLFEFGRTLRKFDDKEFRFRLGSYLTEISEQTLITSGKSGATIAKKMFTVLNSDKFPKELAVMLRNADPKHAADFFADMATVFAKTNLRTKDMRKILQMKWIYSSTKIREAPGVDVMTVGLIMENLSKLSARGPRAHKVIHALSQYANEAVDDAGNLLNSKYQNAWIAHGRRAEVDLLADAPPSFIFGGRIELEVFTKKGFKSSSDVDGAGRVDFNTDSNALEVASGPMTAISIKRAGRTVDNFFTENETKPWFKDDAWIKAYLKSIKDGTGKVGDGNYIPPCPRLLILSGNGLPDAAIKARIDRLAEEVKGIEVEFKAFKSPPPPSN